MVVKRPYGLEKLMIVVSAEDVKEVLAGGVKSVSFLRRDGDVFNGVDCRTGAGRIPGTLSSGPCASSQGGASICVQVEVGKSLGSSAVGSSQRTETVAGIPCMVTGRIWEHGRWLDTTVQIVPVREDRFSRCRGLLETDVLATKSVLLVALGSVGSTVARQIAQLGVGHVTLIDPDRVEVSNVVRHEARLSDVGRLKTNVLAELFLEKNPDAEVATHPIALSKETYDFVAELVAQHHLTIGSIDKRGGRLLLNKACLAKNKPLVVSGAFRRAYGGQVMRVRPGQTPCYQCFISTLPKNGNADRHEPGHQPIAYSDRPVPIEPGLALDIAPICHMTTKVALQELLRDVPTTLRSLDDDLAAHLYLWLNRRETGTQYQELEPLGYGLDGLRALRWYGIDLPRDPHCPACGEFAGHLAAMHGIHITEENRKAFNELQAQGEDIHG